MRYTKLYKYIFTIELCDDSNHDESRTNIIEPLYASYKTNKFKIIEIEDMTINKLVNNYCNYKIGDIIKKNIKYYFTRERAFLSFDEEYFEGAYEPLDKLYYINFFINGYAGIHREWYESGQLREEFYHDNGVVNGDYIKYYENGKIEEEFKVINNKII
jgi:antitoxin component YwqK of YwqJK toxin-antitoxin module